MSRYGAKAKEVAGHAEQQVQGAHAAADKANQLQKVQGGSRFAAKLILLRMYGDVEMTGDVLHVFVFVFKAVRLNFSSSIVRYRLCKMT